MMDMRNPDDLLKQGDGLLVVDVQRDFCPGGAMAIEGGDEIVPVFNGWIEAAQRNGIRVYVSRDWHPVEHVSFEAQGGKWPPHCIQDSDGAGFHPDLVVPDDAVKVSKGARLDQDQKSAFDETGLAVRLEHDGVKRLWVGGLAQDVCVLASVLDARRAGFEVHVLEEATRPVTDEGGKAALQKMEEAGARIVEG
jgi:nicotinamidase/pyrazinamidase